VHKSVPKGSSRNQTLVNLQGRRRATFVEKEEEEYWYLAFNQEEGKNGGGCGKHMGDKEKGIVVIKEKPKDNKGQIQTLFYLSDELV